MATAYAGAAYAASLIAQWVDYSRTYLREAEETSRRALELAPDLAEAHAARGFALSMNGEYAGAAVHFERAIKLDPSFTKHGICTADQDSQREIWNMLNGSGTGHMQCSPRSSRVPSCVSWL